MKIFTGSGHPPNDDGIEDVDMRPQMDHIPSPDGASSRVPMTRHRWKRPMEDSESGKPPRQRTRPEIESGNDSDLQAEAWWNRVEFQETDDENMTSWENPEHALEVRLTCRLLKRVGNSSRMTCVVILWAPSNVELLKLVRNA